MAGEATISFVGNTTADAELRFLPSGVAVANFTVAVTARSKNSSTNQWEDGDTAFYRCAAWRDMAEHVAESIKRGTRVVVTGRLKPRTYTSDGSDVERTSLDVEVDEVGISLRFGTATFNKAERTAGAPPAGTPDPWATGATTPPQSGGWGAPAGAPPGWTQPQVTAPQGPPPAAPAPQQAPPGWGPPPTYDQPPY